MTDLTRLATGSRSFLHRLDVGVDPVDIEGEVLQGQAADIGRAQVADVRERE
jgi:hypothetical protein